MANEDPNLDETKFLIVKIFIVSYYTHRKNTLGVPIGQDNTTRTSVGTTMVTMTIKVTTEAL